MIMKQNLVIEIICFLLILLFVYAALSKLFDYASFKNQLRLSPYLSSISMVAWIIPVLELLTILMLIFSATRLIGLYTCFFLLLAFTIYITLMLLFTKHLPCSCGGVIKLLSWKQHLLFNIFFLGVSALGIYVECEHKKHPVKIRQY